MLATLSAVPLCDLVRIPFLFPAFVLAFFSVVLQFTIQFTSIDPIAVFAVHTIFDCAGLFVSSAVGFFAEFRTALITKVQFDLFHLFLKSLFVEFFQLSNRISQSFFFGLIDAAGQSRDVAVAHD